ncbi:MAG: imidazole glycerol phosphate synthase subunit HisH [Spirochaetia bacterium]|nr:imidazole glycerol phosphate synthase subunit HisH [Spirochaetia bacterium]MBQ3647750.1 imidazole glycerol phosphate synthase subunit HisH [Spirochaetia bacterium]MBQ6674029.1 imidazole glycerol phosphate synthase subunit HisH [Spirochaetia bacterium]MBQ6904927.1 imidazole glycerol phosphate synthase subunit HisH [Spirochaetia bacterium]MBR0318555.1 imidazole glycerol phosphate synthase subunit HisH [Spirochaetia bacterium]
MKIGVVDYKAGNLRSIQNLLQFLGADFIISDQAENLFKCDKLIFPGVGEAAYAMGQLDKTGLGSMIKDFAKTGKPLFGICLGCQIILDHTEEGDVECLGLIPGTAKRFPSGGLKVPEIGWNSFKKVQDHYLLKDIPADPDVYFVHSYYPYVEPKYGIAQTEYMVPFYSIIGRDNVAASQFHPEKSGPVGIQIMKNFIAYGG